MIDQSFNITFDQMICTNCQTLEVGPGIDLIDNLRRMTGIGQYAAIGESSHSDYGRGSRESALIP